MTRNRIRHPLTRFLRGVFHGLLAAGTLACSDSGTSGTPRTGMARIQVDGLQSGAASGGSAVVAHLSGGHSPIYINIPRTGVAEASDVPVGQVRVSYTPPPNHQVVGSQSAVRYGSVKKGKTYSNSFSVERQTGRVSIAVSGLDQSASSGGTATVAHTEDIAPPVTMTVGANGTGEINGVPVGHVRADFSPPEGHRPRPGESTYREGTVLPNSTLPFSFNVESTTGAVEIEVSGFDDRVITGGHAVVVHAEGAMLPVWIDISGDGIGRTSGIPEGEYEITYHPPEGYLIAQGDSVVRVGMSTAPLTERFQFSVEPAFGALLIEVDGLEPGTQVGGTVTAIHVPGTIGAVNASIDGAGTAEVPDFPAGEALVRFSPPPGHSLAPGEVGSRRMTVTRGQTEVVAYQVGPTQKVTALEITRLDGGQGDVLVSNGIPLRPGDLMPSDLDHVRLSVEGVEQALYVESLKGRHPDGSLRSILIQFQYPVVTGAPETGTLRWDTDGTRSLPDRSRSLPPATPAAVALPTDPTFLVATGITIHPAMTEAEARIELAGTVFDRALDIFRTGSDAHWGAFGADYLKTTNIYDRALNHFTFWAMTGEVKYWYRAVANALEARSGSTDNPQSEGVAPRFYQPDGMGMHYLLTGDEESIDYLVGGVVRLSLMAQHNPVNLARFGIPPEGYEYNEGRIRARVLLGTLWAWLLEDTRTDWGSRADQIVEGMIQGQNPDGSFTYRLGTDATPAANLRYGQSNYMEGLAVDALVKYYILRSQNPGIIDLVQKQVDFLDGTEWNHNAKAWHYWSPDSAWDMGDGKVPLEGSDELNPLITISHYWADYMRGSIQNRARADAAFAKTFLPGGADFGTTWGKKVFNQAFMNGLAQMYYRQR